MAKPLFLALALLAIIAFHFSCRKVDVITKPAKTTGIVSNFFTKRNPIDPYVQKILNFIQSENVKVNFVESALGADRSRLKQSI